LESLEHLEPEKDFFQIYQIHDYHETRYKHDGEPEKDFFQMYEVDDFVEKTRFEYRGP